MSFDDKLSTILNSTYDSKLWNILSAMKEQTIMFYAMREAVLFRLKHQLEK